MLNHYICTVCSKRWGEDLEGSELQLTRCEKHKDTMTAAEIISKGMSQGNYQQMLVRRRDRIERKKSRELVPAQS